MGRGSRILTYHRLLKEYRDLDAIWESAKRNAAHYLALTRHKERMQRRVATGTDFTAGRTDIERSEEHTSELQSLMRNSSAVSSSRTKKQEPVTLCHILINSNHQQN